LSRGPLHFGHPPRGGSTIASMRPGTSRPGSAAPAAGTRAAWTSCSATGACASSATPWTCWRGAQSARGTAASQARIC